MQATFLKKVKRRLLHLFTAVLAGVLVTALLEICLWMALFHFSPGEYDDSGFKGVGAIALLVITAWVGIPLFSALGYWLLNSRFSPRKA